LLNINISTLSS